MAKKTYIDYDELRRILRHRQEVRGSPERMDEIGEIIAVIDNMATDSASHARWLTTDAYPHWLYCSNCCMRFVPNHEWLAAYGIPANYCPHCGKPMWNGNPQNIWCGDVIPEGRQVCPKCEKGAENGTSD